LHVYINSQIILNFFWATLQIKFANICLFLANKQKLIKSMNDEVKRSLWFLNFILHNVICRIKVLKLVFFLSIDSPESSKRNSTFRTQWKFEIRNVNTYSVYNATGFISFLLKSWRFSLSLVYVIIIVIIVS
jgi:hypothetical protein